MGARAYATGNDVAFQSSPDLHTAAHEAAHVVQQRSGVSLKGGVGQAGDRYEQHADAVADLVVQGKPAERVLGQMAVAGGGPAIQRTGPGMSREQLQQQWNVAYDSWARTGQYQQLLSHPDMDVRRRALGHLCTLAYQNIWKERWAEYKAKYNFPIPAKHAAKVQDQQEPGELIEGLTQDDDNKGESRAGSETDTDQARCQSNVVIAGLLNRGGELELKRGLRAALVKARAKLAAANSGVSDLNVVSRIQRLERAIAVLEQTVNTPRLSQKQLDLAADALYKIFATDKRFGTTGQVSVAGTGMDTKQITEMEQTVGLTRQQEPEAVAGSNAGEVSGQVWGQIGNGEQAHVGVSPVDRDGGRVSHAVLYGRLPDGRRFIYDPGTGQRLVEGDPGVDIDAETRRRVAQDQEGSHVKVTKFDGKPPVDSGGS